MFTINATFKFSFHYFEKLFEYSFHVGFGLTCYLEISEIKTLKAIYENNTPLSESLPTRLLQLHFVKGRQFSIDVTTVS